MIVKTRAIKFGDVSVKAVKKDFSADGWWVQLNFIAHRMREI